MQQLVWHSLRRIYAIIFSAFVLFPLVVILILSFTNEGYNRFPPASYGLRWYREALDTPAFVDGFLFSLQIATVVTLISGLLGVAAAIGLNRATFAGRNFIIGVIMVPLALPAMVMAIGLLQIFTVAGIVTSPYALAICHVLLTVPYVLRLTLASLGSFNRTLELASYSLGASRWYTFRRVMLPLIAPGLAGGLLFAFLLSFDEVTAGIFLSVPGATTLPAEIFGYAAQGADPVVTAVSGLMVIFAAVLVAFIERFFGVLRLIADEQPSH